MKGAMELEYVVKMVILTVVVAVVISILLYFQEDIKHKIHGFSNENKEVEPRFIKGNFTTIQIQNYIESCWSLTGELYHKNAVCYILEGNFSDVDKDVLNNLKCCRINLTNFNTSKPVATIKFQDLGNIIYVES